MVVVILEPRKMTGMILVSTEVMVVTYEVVDVLKCVVAGTSTLSSVCVLDTVVTILVAGPWRKEDTRSEPGVTETRTSDNMHIENFAFTVHGWCLCKPYIH